VIYHGQAAIDALESAERILLTELERRTVWCEGYATKEYYCENGVKTSGCGQTGHWIGKPFRECFNYHADRAAARFPEWRLFPPHLKIELVQIEYRGDLGKSKKTCTLIRARKWEEAAIEFINHKEFQDPDTSAGIKARILAVHYALMLRAVQYV
jgi:hypothetical protein